jgi:hypothetical protein
MVSPAKTQRHTSVCNVAQAAECSRSTDTVAGRPAGPAVRALTRPGPGGAW